MSEAARKTVDLNCDLGEGGPHDAALMPLASSANIACGGHAGDDATMAAAVTLARRQGVAIGAHPGHADRQHFGRRELPITPHAAAMLVRGTSSCTAASITRWPATTNWPGRSRRRSRPAGQA